MNIPRISKDIYKPFDYRQTGEGLYDIMLGDQVFVPNLGYDIQYWVTRLNEAHARMICEHELRTNPLSPFLSGQP